MALLGNQLTDRWFRPDLPFRYSEVIVILNFFSKSLVPLISLHPRSRHLASRSITLRSVNIYGCHPAKRNNSSCCFEVFTQSAIVTQMTRLSLDSPDGRPGILRLTNRVRKEPAAGGV